MEFQLSIILKNIFFLIDQLYFYFKTWISSTFLFVNLQSFFVVDKNLDIFFTNVTLVQEKAITSIVDRTHYSHINRVLLPPQQSRGETTATAVCFQLKTNNMFVRVQMMSLFVSEALHVYMIKKEIEKVTCCVQFLSVGVGC